MALAQSSTAVSSQLALTAFAVAGQATPSQHLSCSFFPSPAVQPLRASLSARPSSRIQPRVTRRTPPRAVAEAEGAVAEAPPAVEEVAIVADPVPVLSKKQKKQMAPPSNRQLLILRFLWLEKNIGIGLDQLVPGQGTVPSSPYLFWPRKDAWEQLKALLDEKPWVSRKRAIILLNQATDIINLWQSTTFKQ